MYLVKHLISWFSNLFHNNIYFYLMRMNRNYPTDVLRKQVVVFCLKFLIHRLSKSGHRQGSQGSPEHDVRVLTFEFQLPIELTCQ